MADPGVVDITVAPTTLLTITIEGGLEGDSPVGIEATCIDGTELDWTGLFTDLTANPPAPADPERVAFSFQTNQETEPTVYVYGVDAELVKVKVGEYRVATDTTAMAPTGDKAYLTGQFTGAPRVESDSTIGVQGDATVLVLAPKIVNPFG